MQVSGTRQLAAWRRRELPPVEQVTSGVWSVPVPIPNSPLRYVLSYLIEHESGFVMVDTGWNHPDSWRALTTGLDSCGIPMTAITAVLVTHVHPDHHGLSGAVRERSGAWIGMHEREDAWLAGLAGEMSPQRDRFLTFLRWCGATPEHVAELASARGAGAQPERMARADRTLGHDRLVDVPGLRLRAVWTPGHTPGHLCFHDETRDLLLTGDHVLPRITPNISIYDMTSEPLADYLQSLADLHGIQPAEVLPAHEYRFRDLDARLDVLAAHHDERLQEIGRVLGSPSSDLSTWQVASRVSWARRWEDLSGFPRQAAIGEVLSHLRHLQRQDLAACTDRDGVGRWTGVTAALRLSS
ncbi:MAG: MBL fold metallo-hydrolase [Streptosporangiaceae bacterium]|jgi:glyoxylase-like metal-dependent hydrolase (beta-lactamase superfamily II)